MRYKQIQTMNPVIEYTSAVLSRHLLAGERVLWLLSGGSAVELEVRIAQAMQTLDVSRLTVGLIDERYGPPGHSNENYLALMQAHFPFYITRVLSGESAKKTARTYGTFITKTLEEVDFSLGIFGIGSDGHTAGIKPHSPAVTSTTSVVYYEWDDHQRITLTPPTIRHLNEAIIYAVGDDKFETLSTLLHGNTPLAQQPAQLLKDIQTSTLYTNNDLDSAE